MKYNLGTIDVVLGDGESITLNADELIHITDDVSEEYRQQASKYAYVALLCARAEALHLSSKRSLEDIKARTDKYIRQTMTEKMTEPQIANAITISQSVSEAADMEIAYGLQYKLLKALVAALDQRKEMLINYGAQARQEWDMTDMKVRTQAVKARLEEIHRK